MVFFMYIVLFYFTIVKYLSFPISYQFVIFSLPNKARGVLPLSSTFFHILLHHPYPPIYTHKHNTFEMLKYARGFRLLLLLMVMVQSVFMG